MGVEDVMRASPVIAVLTVEDATQAKPMAEALVAGGVRTLEVTLRTPAALDAIAAMAKVEGAVVGAGTVRDPSQLRSAVSAGARFIVSPGLTPRLAEAALQADLPFLPGVATASEIMCGLELGLRHFKFFPAEAAGGLPALRSLAGPFADVRFCPTGGISETSLPDWLALPQVLCVGGSWLVPARGFDPVATRQAAERAIAAAGKAGRAHR